MEKHNQRSESRRGFLGKLAAGTSALGISIFGSPLAAAAKNIQQNNPEDPDTWFNKIKGKHKVIFDCTRPHEIFPFAWPKVFLLTNQATGTAPKDCSVVVVLRHDAIPYAFEDRLWAKYKFGEVFKAGDLGKAFRAADAATAVSTRNPFWKPKPGDFMMPAFGELPIGINDLQADGVMFCVCDAAITVYSAVLAPGMNMDAADVKKDWLSGLLPGVQVVPSGVWAVGRAQEHGCGYIFAG